jgi:hypothetical protein
LLRKGRLLGRYEFKPLCIEKSLLLLDKLGVPEFPVSEPMTLADIYNYKEKNFGNSVNHRERIGFKMNGVAEEV